MEYYEAIQELGKTSEQREGRYYGELLGRITNANDSLGLGRVKAKFAGQADGEESDWIAPEWPGAIECIPAVGDIAIVRFIDGDPGRPTFTRTVDSKTKNRPTDFMALGTTQQGMINFFTDQFNQLRTDVNTFMSQAVAHTHAYLPGPGPSAFTGPASGSTPPISISSTTALSANKGKAADGSVISNVTTSAVVTSGRAKIGV